MMKSCHPERSEGSTLEGSKILRCTQDDLFSFVRVKNVRETFLLRSHRLRRSAFTLLEIIITLGLMVLIAAILGSSVIDWTAADRLARTTNELRALLVDLRVRAIEDGKELVFAFQPNTGTYLVEESGMEMSSAMTGIDPEQSSSGSEAFFGEKTLEEGLTLTPWIDQATSMFASTMTGTEENWWQIHFRPDGTTSEATFVLAEEDGNAMKFHVRGLTGIVTAEKIDTEEGTRMKEEEK